MISTEKNDNQRETSTVDVDAVVPLHSMIGYSSVIRAISIPKTPNYYPKTTILMFFVFIFYFLYFFVKVGERRILVSLRVVMRRRHLVCYRRNAFAAKPKINFVSCVTVTILLSNCTAIKYVVKNHVHVFVRHFVNNLVLSKYYPLTSLNSQY